MVHLQPNSTSFADKLLSFCQVHLPPLHIMQLTTIVPILLCLFTKLECILNVWNHNSSDARGLLLLLWRQEDDTLAAQLDKLCWQVAEHLPGTLAPLTYHAANHYRPNTSLFIYETRMPSSRMIPVHGYLLQPGQHRFSPGKNDQ
jgi:hypothetical protein